MGKNFLIAVVVVVGLTQLWMRQPGAVAVVAPPPEVRIAAPTEREFPVQRDIASRAAFDVNGLAVRPLAEYAVTARVLSIERYHSGRESSLSPVDFALGWGRMSDPAVVSRLSISQSGRWYHWRYSGEPPIPHREIEVSSANVHLVPASKEVARALARAQTGSIVSLRGYLIEAQGSDGWSWRSSLSRDDTGNGACEIMFVQAVDING